MYNGESFQIHENMSEPTGAVKIIIKITFSFFFNKFWINFVWWGIEHQDTYHLLYQINFWIDIQSSNLWNRRLTTVI